MFHPGTHLQIGSKRRQNHPDEMPRSTGSIRSAQKMCFTNCFIPTARVLSRVPCRFPTSVRRTCTRTAPTMGRTMRFRPCIDLHDGRVKQIVGGTLRDGDEGPSTNFSTNESAAAFAEQYAADNLPGGHVIMLGPGNEHAALSALAAFPDGLQIGGGMRPETAGKYLDGGASHVIVTSYVFRDGQIVWERVDEMRRAIGTHRLVLDVSCRRGRDGQYYVCTDRWQKWTEFAVNEENVGRLGELCDELLVHAVDVEGMMRGVDAELVDGLGRWAAGPITYAGGVRSLADVEVVRDFGGGSVDVTIGSALDIFGGPMKYADAVAWQRAEEKRR